VKVLNFLKIKIFNSINISFESAEQHFTNYAIAVLIGIFGFYIFNMWAHNASGYENFLLRLISALLAFFLLFRNYWPIKSRTFLLIYWYFTLIFTLPFFFTFMLLYNASLSLWHVNGLICLVVLALFADWVTYIILSILGIGLGVIVFCFSRSNLPFPYELSGVVLNYIAPIIYIMLFSIKREHIHQEKQKSLQAQAAAIAHEMRTPLAGISITSSMLKKNLPSLITFYRQNSDGEKDKLEERQLTRIEEAPIEIDTISREAFSFIDMMLMNLRQDFSEISTTVCSIKNCLEIALKEYPFNEEDRSLITELPRVDFEFRGNKLFIKYVFFNLFKNSIYYVRAARKGDIRITSTIDENFNSLSFKDTGTGIASKDLPYVFDKFYSKTKYGTGIGLAFCKMVVQNLGGKITCYSKEGEYTEFVLSFPKTMKN